MYNFDSFFFAYFLFLRKRINLSARRKGRRKTLLTKYKKKERDRERRDTYRRHTNTHTNKKHEFKLMNFDSNVGIFLNRIINNPYDFYWPILLKSSFELISKKTHFYSS